MLTIKKELINKSLADASHLGTSFDPERRSEQEIEEFIRIIENTYNELQKYATSDEQKLLLDQEMERFQIGFAGKFNNKLATQGRCISTFITGASNFPTRRAEKANNSYEKRWREMFEWRTKVIKSIIKKLKDLETEESGGEIKILKRKILSAEKNQEEMKIINVIIRKNVSNDEKIKEIMKISSLTEVQIIKLLIPDFAGRVGFATFNLQNNLANIKRMKERLIELGKREITPTNEISFDGGKIINNSEYDRVQIFFDQKPSQNIIDKLKSEGWHWSPSIGVWQRKLTENAKNSANRIVNFK